MRYDRTLDADKSDSRFSRSGSDIVIRRGDAESYEIRMSLRQGGEVVDLTGLTARLYATKPDGSAVMDGENLEVVDAKAGTVTYTVPGELIDTLGRIYPCYVRLTEGGDSEWSLSTDSFGIEVRDGASSLLSTGSYVPELDRLIAEMDLEMSRYAEVMADYAEAEQGRADAELVRGTSENMRVSAENQRASSEAERGSNESARVNAEGLRAAAEQLRASAETTRAAEFAVMESKAQEWVPRILVEGEYDPITRKPTLAAGEFCTVYMAPSADSADMNAYDEYMWVPDDSEAGGHFEKLGASSVDFPAATADEVAGILDGTVTQGGAGITVTAMAALKAAFDDAYAASQHSHAIADVEGLRGELDDLDAAIGKLPVMADVDAKAGTGSGEEKVDSADVKGSPGEGGYMDVYAKKGGDALMLRAWDAGTVEMIRFDGDGYESDWELNAHHLLSDIRGSATDLSYAALRALKPGCYLVPSTAANQPTSGQGDGNLLVGRVSDNRVWAVVAYNTGAVYSAYGYEHQGSTANFGWRRVDNAEPALPRTNRGMLTDLSWSALYSIAQTAPGTYLVANNATGGPQSGYYGNLFVAMSNGNRMVALLAYDNGPVFAMYASDANHWTRIDNGAVTLSSLGAAASSHNHSAANITSGTLPVSRGGTGCTAIKGTGGIVHSLFADNLTDVNHIPCFGTSWNTTGYFTRQQLRNAMGLGNTLGAVPVANGGTGSTTAVNGFNALGGVNFVRDSSGNAGVYGKHAGGSTAGFATGDWSNGTDYAVALKANPSNKVLVGTSYAYYRSMSAASWDTVSDRKLKKDISALADDPRYLRFVRLLRPSMFRYVEGTSGRYHLGFIAQEVEQALNDAGIPLAENAIVTIDYTDDEGNLVSFEEAEALGWGDEHAHYMLRMDNFTALNTMLAQQALERFEEVDDMCCSLYEQLVAQDAAMDEQDAALCELYETMTGGE